MWIKKLIKRIKVRWILWTKRSSMMKTYQEEIVSYEKTCFKICLKLISNPNSEFMIAPMSQKRYIVNNIFGIFIVMDYGRVEITNHVFNYIETEKRRTQTESDVNSRITHSLDMVLERISNLK
jgi:hypothetical protein